MAVHQLAIKPDDATATIDPQWAAYGRDDMKTPNLDKIADEGVRFTRFYNTTAICMASRAQFMSGTYEFSNGCNFDRGNMTHEVWEQSYPTLLKRNGYITGFAGKFGFRVDEKDDSKGYGLDE